MSKAVSAVKGEGDEADTNELSGAHTTSTQPTAMSTMSSLMSHSAPPLITSAIMLGLIFGGCCSNVYALEAIISVEPSAGTLLTFVQFLFVAVTGYVAQFDKTRPPLFLTPNKVPLRRWMVNIVLFFSINVLNNHAFSYDISVPVHIIIRSGGSITTMVAGYLYGKRYSRIQVLAVLLLTIGVIKAAWSDAQAKGDAHGSSNAGASTGLLILFVAQILSAIMGLYTEATYREYGPHWRENLFYSHLLSLPLFAPFASAIHSSYIKMMASSPLDVQSGIPVVGRLFAQTPNQLIFLVINVLTQYACIRGVNLLAAVSTALTVTIVLNIRKLISLLLSIWLFGNTLATGTLLGAVVVFSAGGLYTFGSSPSKPKMVSQQQPEQTQPGTKKEG